MKKQTIICILFLLALPIVLPASASLVGTAVPVQIPGPSPSPSPSPIPTISPGPVTVTSNDVSDQVPADLTDITGLDPVAMAALDSAINMAWPPATSSGLSPLQEIMAFDVGGMTISPFGQYSNSAMSTIPVSTIMSDDLGWLFN